MRSYGQYCSVAKALDLVGDRWTLLIVRELLLRGSIRYTDLRDALPGIATNLLADRLRGLEAAGVVAREEPEPPIATTLFRLTPRGEELRPALEALGRWGIPLMVAGPAAGDAFRTPWLTFPVEQFLTDRRPEGPPVRIEVRTDDGAIVIESSEGRIQTLPRTAEEPDAVLSGSPHAVLGLLTGHVDLPGAEALGVRYAGDREALRRLLPERAANGNQRQSSNQASG
jgi:DNA-binding HxlR family transcriptional regulator